MQLVTFSVGGALRLGALLDGSIVDLEKASAAYSRQNGRAPDLALPADMLAFIDQGDEAVQLAQQTVEYCRQARGGPASGLGPDTIFDAGQVKICAPIPRPRKNVICLAGNYASHLKEGSKHLGRDLTLRKAPVFFSKLPTSIIGPGDAIEWDEAVTQKLDYEGELAVVIGKKGKNIPAEAAYDYVFGYTIMNDISARDVQRLHEQYFKGKSLDTSGPLGPCLVHKSQIPDPHSLRLTTRVNGQIRQDTNTALMVRQIPELIQVWSTGITIEPGDIIATGTCAGVGHAMEPPQFLKDGDTVEVTIEAIGTLSNGVKRAVTVVAGSGSRNI